MALDNLREFVAAIDKTGDLTRVARPVSVDKEITEVADRCMKSPGGGPALLFAQPTLRGGGKSEYPVAVNLFGSERRMSLALGVECLDHVGARIAELLALKVPEGLFAKLAMLPRLAEIAKFPPKTVGRPVCQNTVIEQSDVDLAQFPVPICWPEDGGPYITLGGVITRSPESGVRNVGMYRVQVLSKNTLAMHWQRHKVGAAHWRTMAERGEKMPVAIALGGDPASGAGASRQGGDVRSRSPRGSGDRDRRLHRSARRADTRGAVRRPHRVLLARRLLPEGTRHRRDLTGRSHLAAHDRGPPPDGGLRPRPRDRADFPAAEQAHDPRDRRPAHAGRGDLSQPGVREHRQAVPGPGVQGDERPVGAGIDVAGQSDRRRRQGRQRARSQGGLVGRAQSHRS